MTDVTGAARLVVVVVQKWPRAPSVGSPADPRHSWTVTTADPAAAVIVLTMVTSQMMPSPPALPTPVAHAPTDVSDSAIARALLRSVTGPSIARAARPGRSSLKWRRHDALTARDAPRLGAAVAEPAATTARSICSMAISHPDSRMSGSVVATKSTAIGPSGHCSSFDDRLHPASTARMKSRCRCGEPEFCAPPPIR